MQVSQKQLSPEIQNELSSRLTAALRLVQSEQEMQHVLADFFTEMELQVFMKRLAIADALNAGDSYQKIRKDLQVSTATISFVAEQLDKPGMQVLLEKVGADRWAKKTLRGVFKKTK